jgi:hypothetical protein
MLITDGHENFYTFEPRPECSDSAQKLFNRVEAWAGALKPLRGLIVRTSWLGHNESSGLLSPEARRRWKGLLIRVPTDAATVPKWRRHRVRQ